MAPQLEYKIEQVSIYESEDILIECLNMFFGEYTQNGTHNWEDDKYTYQSYYDDDFIMQTTRKRKRDE
jgi:hypothetical protein